MSDYRFEPWNEGYWAGIKVGAEIKQARIIKLLEDRLKGCSGYDCETCGKHEGLTFALALIKGETE